MVSPGGYNCFICFVPSRIPPYYLPTGIATKNQQRWLLTYHSPLSPGTCTRVLTISRVMRRVPKFQKRSKCRHARTLFLAETALGLVPPRLIFTSAKRTRSARIYFSFPTHHTRRCVCFLSLRSARGPAQLSFRPVLDSPNTSPLLRHASKALMDSRKPAKVTRPPSPALATAAGMNLSHKPSVSRRESSATYGPVPSAQQKMGTRAYGAHRGTQKGRRCTTKQ